MVNLKRIIIDNSSRAKQFRYLCFGAKFMTFAKFEIGLTVHFLSRINCYFCSKYKARALAIEGASGVGATTVGMNFAALSALRVV